MTSSIYQGEKKTAIFFELDGVVRRLKREVADEIFKKTGSIPPAPFGLGMQELIWPVVNHIRAMCEVYGAVPVGLDMAPYVEEAADIRSRGGDPAFDIDSYKAIIAETKQLLMMAGLKEPRILACPHRGKETQSFHVSGKKGQSTFEPRCQCRFPSIGLIYQACKELGLGHEDPAERGVFDVFSTNSAEGEPSLLIYRTPEARECALMKCGMSVINVDSILDGSIYLSKLITGDHLKVAQLIRDFNKQHGLGGDLDGGVRDLTKTELPAYAPQLPAHLNKPTLSLRNDRT